MARNKIFVFIGKPGAGKTTLIKKSCPNIHIVDVLSFVKKYEKDGKVPEEKTLNGYKDMYKHLVGLKEKLLILELGCNHPEFNICELEKFENQPDIQIFLCNASIKTCRKRADKRERKFDQEALEKRLRRDFPNSHLRLLENSSLKYTILDMEKTLEENIKLVKKLIAHRRSIS